MGRKRDWFWEYAEELDGRFKCKYCGRDFAGGISRIKSHLSGIKGRDIDTCLKVPDRVRSEAQQAIGNAPSKKKGKNVAISEDDENVVVGDGPSCTTLTCSSTRESKKKAVDEKFMKFQIASGFFKEDSRTFVEFVKAVSEFGPNYALPDWYTDRDKELTEQENEIWWFEGRVKESLRETGCTLMIIYGMDKYAYDDVKVFAYCPKETLFLASGPKDLIRDHLVRIIDGIGSHHIVQVIAHDYEQGHLIEKSYPRVLFTTCATQKFQHLDFKIQDCRFSTDLVLVGRIVYIYLRNFSMEFVRKIFDKYKKYEMLDHQFPNVGLWLLVAIMDIEADVIKIVQSLDTSSSDLARWVADLVADIKFWKLGKQVVHTIDVYFQVLCLGISKVPAFGYLYEAVNKACNAIDECWHHDDDPKRFYNIKNYCQRELRSMIGPLHAAASFLSPAIICCDEFIEDPLMKEGIYYMARNFSIDEIERVSFLDQVQLYRAKTQSIFTERALENLKTLHPGVWWHRFGGGVPVLQKYAIRILSQPCGVPLRILRTKELFRETKWMRHRFRWPEICSMEPIDLDKFTRRCEFVKQESLSDLSNPINNTLEIPYSDEDPFLFWLDNEHRLKRFIIS